MCLAGGQIIIDSRAWVWTDGVALDFDPTSFPVVQKNTIRCARVEFRPPTLPHTVNLYPLPPRHVVGVGSQVGAGLVEGVVKLQIEVMRLQVDRRQHRGHGAGEFAEAIENVLRLQRHTFFERLAVDRRGGPDFPRLFPGTRRVRMERTPRAELALAHRFDRRPHFAKMRRAIALHHARESRGIGVGPTLIGVEAEAEARHSWVAAGAQDAEGVDASKHPAAQSHRLQHQHPGVATGGEFGGGLG
jgi:hypothetical protein